MTKISVVSRKENGRSSPSVSIVRKKFTVWSFVLFTSRAEGPVPTYRQVSSVLTKMTVVASQLFSLLLQVSRKALTSIIVRSVDRLLILLA